MAPCQLLRERGTPYAELGLDDPRWTDEDLVGFILAHPILFNRPIVVTPLGTRLSRQSGAILDILPNRDVGTFAEEEGKVVVAGKGRECARIDRGS